MRICSCSGGEYCMHSRGHNGARQSPPVGGRGGGLWCAVRCRASGSQTGSLMILVLCHGLTSFAIRELSDRIDRGLTCALCKPTGARMTMRWSGKLAGESTVR